MSDGGARGDSLDTARLAIARFRPGDDEGLERACRHAVRISAQKLRCARASVWLFNADRSAIRSIVLYELGSDRESMTTTILSADRYPQYFKALLERRSIAADDAAHDPVTAELAADYLEPLGISSMLDAPIYREGEVAGVVCHEHVGPARTWTREERAFATSVADMLAVTLEQMSRLAAERALREAQKMEALGRLSGAIAHDVNNLLAAIAGAGDVVRRRGGNDAMLAEAAATIVEATKRGAELTRRLLGVARGEPTATVERVDIALLLRRLRPVLRSIAGGVELTLESVEGLAVDADPIQLERILVNLVTNAREAIDGPGRIVVAAAGDEASVVLRVTDTGSGITEEVRAHLFEPFFTTKRTSGGTGIGLATVYALVRQCGGEIMVDSLPRIGTTFMIRLPRAR